MDEKKLIEWKRRVMEVLKEHPDIGGNVTGKIEINLNMGGITDLYVNKRIK